MPNSGYQKVLPELFNSMSVVAVFNADIGPVYVCDVSSSMKIESFSDCRADFRCSSNSGLSHEISYVVGHLILGIMGILWPKTWALVEFMHPRFR